MTARFVKTTTEFEGRYSEVWVLVDEDDAKLAAWDAGAELDIVGKPAPRLDGANKVSGTARYTADIVRPGMLHAAVLRSPLAHGRLVALDVEAARKAPGVRAAVGPQDLRPVGATEPAGDEYHYVGHPIAALAADTPELARAALAAFAVELEPLPFWIDVDSALRDMRLADEPESEVRGDPERAMAEADITIEVEIATPAQLQTAMEPHGAVAEWSSDGLTLWLSTQAIFLARSELASHFGLSVNEVRVIAESVGGGFGAKFGAGIEPIVAAELARRSGRPVRCVNSRREEQIDTGNRGAVKQTVKLGGSRAGDLLAIEADYVAMGGAMTTMLLRTIPMALYACEHVRASTFPMQVNLGPVNAFRAPGVTEGTTVFEQAMDELAGKVGIDPLELRRRAHVTTDQRTGKPYSAKHLLECYDRAAELAGWADRDRLREEQSDGLLRGMGCASQIWYGGGGPPAHITMRLGQDGVTDVVTGIQDMGGGSLTMVQMVAAEELGVPLDRIRVQGGDTRPNVYGPVAGGSGTTGSAMPAVRAAAAKVRRRLLEVAGDVFELSPDDLELRDGRIRSKDRVLDEAYTEVTGLLGNATIDGAGSRGPNDGDYRVQTFGCQIAQVSVDPGLGIVRVERIVAVHDVGRIINPLTASSQVEGGILQGIGYALSEERVVDPTTGAPTNPHLDDYKLPTIADTPEIVLDFIGTPDTIAGTSGAKGLGEPPHIPTAAAIANAFAHATGRRCRTLPLTPAHVIETLTETPG